MHESDFRVIKRGDSDGTGFVRRVHDSEFFTITIGDKTDLLTSVICVGTRIIDTDQVVCVAVCVMAPCKHGIARGVDVDHVRASSAGV